MNDEQRDHRLRLAAGLEKVAEEWPEHFDMQHFVAPWQVVHGWALDDEVPRESETLARHDRGEHPAACGTVACALGWAPYLLGVARRPYEQWEYYGARVLGADEAEFDALFMTWEPGTVRDPLPVAARLRASCGAG